MLIVSRKREEGIIIELPTGETIRVVLIDIDRNKCRIGVQADPHIRVDRDEISDLRARQAGEGAGI